MDQLLELTVAVKELSMEHHRLITHAELRELAAKYAVPAS
jgi:hypothetical protein